MITAADAIRLGERRLTIQDVAMVARGNARVALGPGAVAKIAAGRAVVDRLARSGIGVYGLTTGLGAGVDTAVPPDQLSDFQRSVARARSVGVGPALSSETVRAAMLARANGMAAGGSGASLAAVEALIAALNAGFHPVMPSLGSHGTGDMAQLSCVARALVGDEGARVEIGGNVMSAPAALARAGLAPLVLSGKDGHALVAANAVSVGAAALALVDLARLFEVADAVAALSLEGFRASLEPFDARVIAARPAPRVADAAARIRAALTGSALWAEGAARRVQDPISFRAIAQIHAAAHDAADRARAQAENELNAAMENPLVLADAGTMLHNANFDLSALSFAFEGLALALAQVANASAQRAMKLMSPSVSDLPRFLTPRGQGRAGFATAQKTLAALEAGIRHRALPIAFAPMPVADGIEDMAQMAPATIEKAVEIIDRLRWITAIGMVVAAQAVDLRSIDIATMGRGARAAHAFVRARVKPLDDDRPTGPDFERVADDLERHEVAIG